MYCDSRFSTPKTLSEDNATPLLSPDRKKNHKHRRSFSLSHSFKYSSTSDPSQSCTPLTSKESKQLKLKHKTSSPEKATQAEKVDQISPVNKKMSDDKINPVGTQEVYMTNEPQVTNPVSSTIENSPPVIFKLDKPFFNWNEIDVNEMDIFSRDKINELIQDKFKNENGHFYILALTRDEAGTINIWDGLGLYKSLEQNKLNPLNRSNFSDIVFYWIKDIENKRFEPLFSFMQIGNDLSIKPLEKFFVVNGDLPKKRTIPFHCYLRDVALFFQEQPNHLSEALLWHQRAADSGSFYSSFQTAIMYKKGIGTEINKKNAFEYFSKAYELGKDNKKIEEKYMGWTSKHLYKLYVKGHIDANLEMQQYYLQECKRYLTQT